MDNSIRSFGDGAMLLTIDSGIDENQLTDHLRDIANALRAMNIFDEIVPTYNSLLLEFDPLDMSQKTARARLEAALQTPRITRAKSRIIEIPIAYGGIYGPDLKAAQDTLSLSRKAIIALHSERLYDVAMLGFIPGFAFLSAIDERLEMPRHSTPRANVMAGSVGIANWQTGIYGLQSPGGWQIIGRTPITVFKSDRLPPNILNAGDKIRFVPISAAQFQDYSEPS